MMLKKSVQTQAAAHGIAVWFVVGGDNGFFVQPALYVFN
jgi:hypothetical protein